ncbi:MAG: hypothetical protein EBT93_09970 [Alphaproteobacteria bacterium]|nr:hypothetical protein [Alphaproteobacteria bacterium]
MTNESAFDPTGKDPFALFDAWLAEAESLEINDPNAVALATVSSDGLIYGNNGNTYGGWYTPRVGPSGSSF